MRHSTALFVAAALGAAMGLGACGDCGGGVPDAGEEDSGSTPGQDAGPDGGGGGGGDAGQDGGGGGADGGRPDGGGGQPDGGAGACRQVGEACLNDGNCCTRTCGPGAGGGLVCLTVPGQTCNVTGQACTLDSQCCSTNCANGFCAAAFSCQPYHDVCTTDGECCSFLCNKVGGASSGTCNEPTGAGGCTGAGNPCNTGSDCCSRVCADFGSGATVCQPTIGCRPQGDNCAGAGSCCGSSSMCTAAHKCDNGTACRAAGMICGKPQQLLPDGGLGGCARLPDGGCYTTNQETNCCESNKIGGDEYMCRLDTGGVPRCVGGISGQCPFGYTGAAPCCIAAGNYCDFRDQCCNGLPCTVGADGGRQCVAPTCSGLGTSCSSSSECCAPAECLPTSEVGNACQMRPPPADAGTDAGPPCSPNGSSCSSPGQCCSGICNAMGQCAAPQVCQPQSGACTTSGDCCSGLQCQLSPGSTTGTCQPGSTCGNIGQSCSPTSMCCSGLTCVDPNGLLCTGMTTCACEVIINLHGGGGAEAR